MDEKFSGIGYKARRFMIRLWKENGKGKSLKSWAKTASLGEVAHAWLNHKKGR